MTTERKIAARELPDYHILAAAARREQSMAVRSAIKTVGGLVKGLLNAGRSGEASASHLG